MRQLASSDRHEHTGVREAHCTSSNDEMLDPELQLLANRNVVPVRARGAGRALDTLFVGEAGQGTLADVLAVGTAARNVVLLGDPNQLAQVSQGSHPPGRTHPCSGTCSATTKPDWSALNSGVNVDLSLVSTRRLL